VGPGVRACGVNEASFPGEASPSRKSNFLGQHLTGDLRSSPLSADRPKWLFRFQFSGRRQKWNLPPPRCVGTQFTIIATSLELPLVSSFNIRFIAGVSRRGCVLTLFHIQMGPALCFNIVLPFYGAICWDCCGGGKNLPEAAMNRRRRETFEFRAMSRFFPRSWKISPDRVNWVNN
jgi:hypothetical protein